MPPASPRPLTRRAWLSSTAWAVPAVVLSVPLPAHAAASAVVPVSISTPGDETPPRGEVWLTVTARTPQGAPVTGASVTLTGPSTARFGSTSGVTDGNGLFSTVFDLSDPSATPGSTVSVTAVVAGRTGAVALTVVGPFGSCAAG